MGDDIGEGRFLVKFNDRSVDCVLGRVNRKSRENLLVNDADLIMEYPTFQELD